VADFDLLGEVEEAFGPAAAARLAARLGGQRIWIPTTEEGRRRLADLIGAEVADMLIERYGGIDVYVPMNVRETRVRRERCIAEMAARGLGTREIAARIGCTRRTVQRILARRATKVASGE